VDADRGTTGITAGGSDESEEGRGAGEQESEMGEGSGGVGEEGLGTECMDIDVTLQITRGGEAEQSPELGQMKGGVPSAGMRTDQMEATAGISARGDATAQGDAGTTALE